MSLPYESATAGDKAIAEMQKILRSFGCARFGYLVDDEARTLLVQFSYRDRQVSVKASMAGYAAAWLREHPHTARMRKTRVEHEKQAMEIASVAVFSILRDWVKGQIAAIETGVLSFEAAFLGQIMLPSGRTVMEHVAEKDILPALSAPKEK